MLLSVKKLMVTTKTYAKHMTFPKIFMFYPTDCLILEHKIFKN